MYEAAEKRIQIAEEYDKVKAGATVYDKDGNEYKEGSLVKDITKYYASIKPGILAGDSKVTDVAKVTTKGTTQFTDKDGNEIAANGLGNYINNDGTLKANSGLYINGNLATQDDVAKMVDFSKTFDTGALTLKLHVGADATDNNQISLKIDTMSADGLGVKNLKLMVQMILMPRMQLKQSRKLSRKYPLSVPHLVLFRTDLSTPSTTWTT